MQIFLKTKFLNRLITLFMGLVLFIFPYAVIAQTSSHYFTNYDYHLAQDKLGANPMAKTDFYTLVLSWSPAYCDSVEYRHHGIVPAKDRLQCGQNFGWIIHGLWAENRYARRVQDHPRFCQGDLAQVSPKIIQRYLTDSPSAHLLQAEWEKHGACIFSEPESYFAKQSELYHQLKLPAEKLNKKDLISWLKRHNPSLQGKWIKVSRNEIRICYNLKWQVISCPKSKY